MRYNHGDIVYWVKYRLLEKPSLEIECGVVDEEFSGTVLVDRLHVRDTRYLEGIPYKDYPGVSNWRKLPKGWTYNTKLFELEYKGENIPFTLDIKKPEEIKKCLENGILIFLKDYDQSYPTSEVDLKSGWRIRKQYAGVYSSLRYVEPHISINKCENNIFTKYEHAQERIDAIEKEWKRQSELTDKEWNIENIDRKIDYWGYLFQKTKEEKEYLRNFLLSQPNVEDIEVRISGGEVGAFQWKYEKKRRWSSVDI